MSAIRNLTAIILILAVSSAFGQIAEEWVARYNGPANGGDAANDLAMDAQGYVYVTGGSQGSGTGTDYLTIKYDPDGDTVWTARYDGAGGEDVANAIAVDAEGNVYVTGMSAGLNTMADYATIKYDSNGDTVWTRRYNNSERSRDDVGKDVAVDGEGNVYVTGYSDSTGSAHDYYTIKYNSNGGLVWADRYNNAPTNGTDEASALALDYVGNVYVTGKSTGSGTGYDYCTIKYSPGGAVLMTARYDRPIVNGSDEAVAVAVNRSYCYVTGKSAGSGTGWDYCTIKYLRVWPYTRFWVVHYDGSASGRDEANALALDAEGNIYVTGRSDSLGTFPSDYLTIKYAPSCTLMWTARYNATTGGEEEAHAVAVDAQGNVYVTGESWDNRWSADYATIKYDSAGNQVWVARYNGPGNSEDVPTALAVDAESNVYVTGSSPGDTSFSDYATIKYSPAAPLEMSCTNLTPVFCRGKNVFFLVTTNNNTGAGFNVTMTFQGYTGNGCVTPFGPPKSGVVSVPTGVNTVNYWFKVPGAAGPGLYSASISFSWGGTTYSCCMDFTCVQCVPWKVGDNTEWVWEEVDRPEVGLPTITALAQNYPNPFNATTEVGYNLAEAGEVSLNVYDVTGRLVETLVEGYQEVGEHEVTWDASDVSSGIYFYKLTSGANVITKRMTLLK